MIVALSPHILRAVDVTPEDEEMLWLGIDTQQQPGAYRPYTPMPVPPTIQQPTIEEEEPEDEDEDTDEDEKDEEDEDTEDEEEQ